MYNSKLADIEYSFASGDEGVSVITDGYLISFERCLQAVNICFSNCFVECVDGDKVPYRKSITFHEWLD